MENKFSARPLKRITVTLTKCQYSVLLCPYVSFNLEENVEIFDCLMLYRVVATFVLSGPFTDRLISVHYYYYYYYYYYYIRN